MSFEIGEAEIRVMRSLHRVGNTSSTFRVVDGVYEPIPVCQSCNAEQTAPCFVLQLCDALEKLQDECTELRYSQDLDRSGIKAAQSKLEHMKKMNRSYVEVQDKAIDTVLEALNYKETL